jgi:hypothetical protein
VKQIALPLSAFAIGWGVLILMAKLDPFKILEWFLD